MARMFTDDMDIFTPYPDSLKSKPEKFGGETNAEQDLEIDFANVLLNVFPEACKHECFGMDTESMCCYITDETHFDFLDVVYYKRVDLDEMFFLFGKRLPAVLDKTPASRLSVLKQLMCANYEFKVVYAVYSTRTGKIRGNCFGSIFDAVHSCTSRTNNICKVMVMSVIMVNLFPVQHDSEREFVRNTKYMRAWTEYEMRDKSDYEAVMLLTIQVHGNVSEHTDFLYGPYSKDFVVADASKSIVNEF